MLDAAIRSSSVEASRILWFPFWGFGIKASVFYDVEE